MQRRLSQSISKRSSEPKEPKEPEHAAYTTSTRHPSIALSSLQAHNEVNMSGATLAANGLFTTRTPMSPGTPATAVSSSNSSVYNGKEKDEKKYSGKILDRGVDDKHDAARIIRKVDLRLVPGLALLYLLLFLCRQNIGNAKTFGLSESLDMTQGEYQWALTVFFFTYSTFDIPCNMLLKALGPRIWLPLVTVASGIVCTLMGVVQNPGGLIATRTILGMVECGLFPGVTFTITCWYVKREAQFRNALFFGAASMAGAFAGLLGVALSKMDGVGGYEGWRWILIIEGLLTFVVGCAAFFFIVPPPAKVSWLTESEKRFLRHRLIVDEYGEHDEDYIQAKLQAKTKPAVSKRHIFKSVFSDWKVYAHILVFLGITCPMYSISLCLPTIVKQLGYTSEMANILTIPCYIAACILSIITAYFSDRIGKRTPFVAGGYVLMLLGFLIALFRPADKPSIAYVGLFISTCGLYPAFPGMITWFANNIVPASKRSIAMALHIGTGSFGGAIGSNFYPIKDAPKYSTGHGLNIMFVGLGAISMATLVWRYKVANKERIVLREQERKRVRDEVVREGVLEDEVDAETEKRVKEVMDADIELRGDDSIWFTYMI